jgi:tetratricopeptide (TPR) repeat protein/tRNA A-37 threonylcarbamoyl transferase component Bud32
MGMTGANDSQGSGLDALIGKFEEAWQRGPAPAIEDYLPPGDVTALAELVHVDLERRLKTGDEVRVESYLERFPTLADLPDTVLELIASEYELRRRCEPDLQPTEYFRRFPRYERQLQQRLSGSSAVSPRSPDPECSRTHVTKAGSGDEGASGTPEDAAGRGGRYRPLHFHARGGLGEVLVAHDKQFQRQVALKRIQEPFADDPDSRRRFLLEAEITGRLEHPGVVPAYSLTWDEQGRPCYAMRFIQGETLRDALHRFHHADQANRNAGERSLALRQLLGRFLQVCNTIAYAHSRGVLHRDIKPSNIMLGQYGETLVVDWGLAKATGAKEAARAGGEATPATGADGSAAGTHTGQALGTPAYMSPEQAAGRWDAVGPASDVYGLGATLYALLTGHSPFQGNAEEVLARVQRGEFLPPRQRHREVPRPLDAVCLKAMALEPAGRYPTPLALAEEVEHWLADEPVSAYREPWLVPARRWLKRRRTPVIAIMAAALAVAALGGYVLWRVQEAETEQLAEMVRRVDGDLSEARALQARAEWAEARAVVKRAEGRLAEDAPPDLRGRVRQARDDLEMVARLENILLLQAAVKEDRFDNAAAEPEYRAAFRAYWLNVEVLDTGTAAARIKASAIRAQLVAALDNWAVVKTISDRRGALRLFGIAQRADADRRRRELREEFRKCVLRQANRTRLMQLAARADVATVATTSLHYLALVLNALGEVAAAVEMLERAQRRYPADFWINHDLAFYLMQSKPPRATEAVGFYRAALTLRPDSPGVYLNLGRALENSQQWRQAIAAYTRAVELKPDYLTAHALRAGADASLAVELIRQGKFTQAEAAFRKTIALKSEAPQAVKIRALGYAGLGLLFTKTEELDRAVSACRQALRIDPACAEAFRHLGTALHQQNKLPQAAAALEQALRLKHDEAACASELGMVRFGLKQWPEAVAALQQAVRLKPNEADYHTQLGMAWHGRGKVPEAIAAFREAVRLKPDHLSGLVYLGILLQQQRQFADAVAVFQKALALKPDAGIYYLLGACWSAQRKLPEAAAAYRKATALKPDYADAWNSLGWALYQQNKVAEAVDAYRQTLRLKPDHALAHNNLGIALMWLKKYPEAEAAFQEALRHHHPNRFAVQTNLLLARGLKGKKPATAGQR